MLSREEIEQLMRDGAEAFENGMSRDDCPHAFNSPAFATWMRGYQNAAFGAALSSRSQQ